MRTSLPWIQTTILKLIPNACEPIPNAARDDFRIRSSEGPVLLPVSHGLSLWVVHIIGPKFDPHLEVAGRSVPHPVSLRGC